MQASKKYSKMQIVGVVPGPDGAVDEPAVQRAIRDLGLPYRNVRDRDLALTEALGVEGTPTIVVLGEQGRILYFGHEVPDWDALL